MPTLNLKALDPAELMPLPEVPESYGPRDEEEQRIHELVMEGIHSGPGVVYDTVDDFMLALEARVLR
ncbi:hypothetical protein [Chitinimonas arctica]|nr:hypothetical protein [Chitinimonas arctica]